MLETILKVIQETFRWPDHLNQKLGKEHRHVQALARVFALFLESCDVDGPFACLLDSARNVIFLMGERDDFFLDYICLAIMPRPDV